MSTERALCRNKLVLDHAVNVRIGKQWDNPTKTPVTQVLTTPGRSLAWFSAFSLETTTLMNNC